MRKLPGMKVRGLPKPYKMKIKAKPQLPMSVVKPTVAKEKEQLMGMVNDMKASDIEERFAKSLDKLGLRYYFRLPVGAPRGMPGYNELDFLVQSGGFYPVQIDGEYSHLGSEARDAIADIKIMKGLCEYNPQPIRHVLYTRLSNQKAADMVAREIFG
jgi:hypothetical protein